MSRKEATSINKVSLISMISSETSLSKSQVESVLDSLTAITHREIHQKNTVIIPGIAKIVVHKKKASKARVGRNPKTGEAIQIPAKPATDVVKIKALGVMASAI